MQIRFFDVNGEDYEVRPRNCLSLTGCNRLQFNAIVSELAEPNPETACNNPPNYKHSKEYVQAIASQYIDTSQWNSWTKFSDIGENVIPQLPDSVQNMVREKLDNN